MNAGSMIRETVVGLISGYVGTRAMTPVTTKLQSMASPAETEREKQVSPGVSYNLAASDLAARAGVTIDDDQAERVGTLFHLGLGFTAGVAYVVLRRRVGIRPGAAALLTGGALFAGIDEGLTPLMGWSAPSSAYPASTHLRGAIGHLVLGAATALTAELLMWVFGLSPRRAGT